MTYTLIDPIADTHSPLPIDTSGDFKFPEYDPSDVCEDDAEAWS